MQHQPGQQAGTELHSGTRRLNSRCRHSRKMTGLPPGRQHHGMATGSQTIPAVTKRFMRHHGSNVRQDPQRGEQVCAVPGSSLSHCFLFPCLPLTTKRLPARGVAKPAPERQPMSLRPRRQCRCRERLNQLFRCCPRRNADTPTRAHRQPRNSSPRRSWCALDIHVQQSCAWISDRLLRIGKVGSKKANPSIELKCDVF